MKAFILLLVIGSATLFSGTYQGDLFSGCSGGETASTSKDRLRRSYQDLLDDPRILPPLTRTPRPPRLLTGELAVAEDQVKDACHLYMLELSTSGENAAVIEYARQRYRKAQERMMALLRGRPRRGR